MKDYQEKITKILCGREMNSAWDYKDIRLTPQILEAIFKAVEKTIDIILEKNNKATIDLCDDLLADQRQRFKEQNFLFTKKGTPC
jgi:hypothetical protein